MGASAESAGVGRAREAIAEAGNQVVAERGRPRRRRAKQKPTEGSVSAADRLERVGHRTMTSVGPTIVVDPVRGRGHIAFGQPQRSELERLPRLHRNIVGNAVDDPSGRRGAEAAVAVENQHRRAVGSTFRSAWRLTSCGRRSACGHGWPSSGEPEGVSCVCALTSLQARRPRTENGRPGLAPREVDRFDP